MPRSTSRPCRPSDTLERSHPPGSALLFLVSTVALMITLGCSGEKAGTGNSDTPAHPLLPDTEPDSLTYADLVASQGQFTKARERYRIGVIVKFLGNPFWQTMAEGMRQRSSELGVDIDIRAARSELDEAGQLATLNAMITSDPRPDILLLSPLTSDNLLPAIALAHQSGIPIINVDGALLPAARHWVGAPNYQKGELAAQFLMQEKPEGGEFAIIMGLEGIYDAEQRTNGFAETLAKLTDDRFIEVARQHCDWDLHKALEAVTSILEQHPNLIGIYCNNDTMVLGATEAVEAAGKGDQVVVIGTDGIADALSSIRSGRLDATIDPAPNRAGGIAVEAAVRLLEGQALPRALYVPQSLIEATSLTEQPEP